jgi:uncharacterized membrane protein
MLWYMHVPLMLIMMVCDAAWIRLNMARYTENIMAIQNTTTYSMWYVLALPIYAVMYLSVVLIAVPLHAVYGLGAGALVGGAIYGVYNLCVLLQFENSSAVLACMDSVWGTLLFMALTRLAVAL